MVIKMWRQEWRVDSFTLNYHTPEHFTRCHWQKQDRVTPMWIVYRAFTALYFLFSLIYTISPIGREVPEENTNKYLIFLTHWTYLAEVFVFVLSFLIVVIRAAREKKSPEPMEKMPWYYKLYWVFYTIVLPCAVVVSFIFWVFVYDEGIYPVNLSNVMEHILNSVFIILDFWLVGHPVKFLHFYWPMSYGVLYSLFSLVYQLSGGRGVKGEIPIYRILDWRKPWPTIGTCAATSIFLLMIYFLFCCFSICKTRMKRTNNENQ